MKVIGDIALAVDLARFHGQFELFRFNLLAAKFDGT